MALNIIGKDRLKSTGFTHFEDDEADVHFEAYQIVRKEKRFVEYLWDRPDLL